jgi:hypothetical protein
VDLLNRDQSPGMMHIIRDLPDRVNAPVLVVDQALEGLSQRRMLSLKRLAGGGFIVTGISPALRRIVQ